jgi:Fe-S cluster assembly protein SufD
MNTTAVSRVKNLPDSWAETVRNHSFPDSPEWLRQLRQNASDEFLSHGLPGNKDEAWKYTSLRPLEALNTAIVAELDSRSGAEVTSAEWLQADFGFQLGNGQFEGPVDPLPDGVSMWSLEQAFEQARCGKLDILKSVLEGMEIKGRSHAFKALNTALLNQGLVIHVASGVDAGTCLARLGSVSGDTSGLSNFRLILILEDGAKLKLLEHFQQNDSSLEVQRTGQAMNLVIQGFLSANARLEQIRIQNAAAVDILLTVNQFEQKENSLYRYTGFDMGGGLVRHEISCRLAGQGAHAEIAGAFVVDGDRHVDNHINVDHDAPGCSSEQFFRGVLGGRSRAVFNGKALIRAGADGSSVRQSNANLLLSHLAEIDTKPELEIYADEVEASHGATVGQLDEQAIFYLRARGLTEAAARHMLTAAFCRSVTSRLDDQEMAEQVGALLDAAMPEQVSVDQD